MRSRFAVLLALGFAAVSVSAAGIPIGAIREALKGPKKKGRLMFLRVVMQNGSELNSKKTIHALEDAGSKVVYSMAHDRWYGVYYITAPSGARGDLLLSLFGDGGGRLIEEIPAEDETGYTPTPKELMDPTYRPPPRKMSLPAFPLDVYVRFNPSATPDAVVRSQIRGACLKRYAPEQGQYWILALDEKNFADSLASLSGLQDVRLVDPTPLPEDLYLLASTSPPSAARLSDCPKTPDAPADPMAGVVPPSLKDPPRTGYVVYTDAASSETVGVAATLGDVLITFKDAVEPQTADVFFRQHGGMIFDKPFDSGTYRVFVPYGTEGAFITSMLRDASVAKAVPEILRQAKSPP